jgi:hypothetical protein
MIEAGSKIDDGMAISLDGRKKNKRHASSFLSLQTKGFEDWTRHNEKRENWTRQDESKRTKRKKKRISRITKSHKTTAH